MTDFVHLHLHTEYSLLDGAIHVDELVDEAGRLGMKAMAITDHGNLFGAVAFHDTCREKGLRPILGCEIYVATGSRFDKSASGITEAYNHLTLLASDAHGYHNLVKLVSLAYTEGFYHRPRVDKDLLARHHEGLVALSGCLSSEVSVHLRNGREAAALEAIGQFTEIFGRERFYLEIMDHGIEEQRRVNQGLLRLRDRTGLPLVATNDAHYLQRDDEVLPTLVAIATLPIVLADGALLAPDGLDRDRGIMFIIRKELTTIIPRQQDCTDKAIKKAMRFLCDEWLCDVATDYAGKCTLIAAALTVIERSLLPDRPAFFVTATRRRQDHDPDHADHGRNGDKTSRRSVVDE